MKNSVKNLYFVVDKYGGGETYSSFGVKKHWVDKTYDDLEPLCCMLRMKRVIGMKREKYQKPVVNVMKYTPNQAVSACGTSVKVTCLIGGQELVFYSSCSGGAISEFFKYEYTDSSGNTTTYIIWYYDYGSGPSDQSGTYWTILGYWLSDNNITDEKGWHIATEEAFGNSLYAKS